MYIGGHGGYTSGAFSQRDAVTSALASYFNAPATSSLNFGVSKLVARPGSRGRGASYGAFAGFNMQFDDVVLGVEADYTHTNLTTTSQYGIGRSMTTSGGNYETVVLNGLSKTEIQDYGTIRGRAGYAFGNFLPFVTGGFAIAQVRFSDTVGVQNYGYDNRAYTANQALTAGSVRRSPSPTTATAPSTRISRSPTRRPRRRCSDQAFPATTLVANDRVKTIGGVALGFGIDYAITPNVMLRGEYQYINFRASTAIPPS